MSKRSRVGVVLAVLAVLGPMAAGAQSPAAGGAGARGAAPPAAQGVMPRDTLPAGWQFQVTRIDAVKGIWGPMSDPQQRSAIQMSVKLEFDYQVDEGSRPDRHVAVVTVRTAQQSRLNPETGQVEVHAPAQPGQKFRLIHTPRGASLSDLERNRMIRDEQVLDLFARPIVSRLWPDGKLAPGQNWSYGGDELTRRLKLIDVQGGRVDLRVEKIAPDATTGLATAHIRGELRTRVDFDPAPLDFAGSVQIDLPVEIGVPFVTKIEGDLSGQATVQDQFGQVVAISIQAEGSALQSCKPSDAIIRQVAAKPGPRKLSPEEIEALYEKYSKKSQDSDGAAEPNAITGLPTTIVFRRVAEPKENAFTMLAPKGWIVEGGIVRIDPLQQGGPTQSIEAKLDLTISSPDGTVVVRALPETYFVDTRYMPAAQLFPPGSNYNGMTVIPLPSAVDFLAKVVLPEVHGPIPGLEVVQARSLPELAKKFRQREVALTPLKSEFGYDAGVLVAAYRLGDVRYTEVLFTIIEDFGQPGAGMWKNRETFFVRTPADELAKWEPVFNIMRRSVELDPKWLVGEIQGQITRGEIVISTQQDIERISREIAEHRQRTNAEIQNDMFLTLTDQEEYVNPYTNQVEIGSNQWRHRWINESGDVIYTNDDNYDPRVDVNLNRSDYKKTPVRKRFGQ